MKKIKLFLAACAAMVGLSASAQGWTGQSPADGDFYLYNVGTGTFLSCGSEYWGTKACIDNGALNFTLANNGEGAYTLYTTSTFSYGNPNTAQLQSSGYVDQSVSATTWTFTPVDGQENTYTMLNAAGTYLVAPSDGTKSILLNAEAPTTNYGYWKLINKANLFPETASESNPADITCLIGDASFESTNDEMENFWTIVASNNNLKLGTDKGLKPNNVVESWQSSNGFTLSQTITVPNGYYRLTAQTWCREYTVTGADLPYIYLNDVQKSFNLMGTETASLGTVADFFSNGDNGNYFTTTTDIATVSGKSITLGAKGTRTNTWNVFDNFKLYYLGPIDLSTYVTELANAVAAAEATEGTIPTAAYEAIAAVVEENNKTYEDGDAYSAAITAINNAVSTYASPSIVAAYTNYNNVKAAVLAVDNTIDVTAADALANDGTDANLDDAVAAVRTALKDYLKTTDKTNVSLTAALLINPSFETGDFTGWTNNGMALQTNTSFGKDGNVYCEKWQPNGTFSVSQTITSMPAGVYQLTAKAKARGVSSAKLSVAGIEKAITIADSEADYTIEFAIDDNTDVTIAYEGVGTGAASSWLVVDNFRLALASAGLPDVTAVDGKMNAEIATAQAAAINAYNSDKTVANYNAVQAAIANAEASVAAYAKAATALVDANALKEAHNFASEAATTTFAEAIAAIQTKYDEGTLTDAEATAGGNLGMIATGWHGGNNTPAAVYLRDGFALGADFAADPALHVNTWSTEGATDGSNFTIPFYESWTADANSLPESTLSGTISDLPNGLYKVSALVRVAAKTGVNATDAAGITMDVNNGTAVDVTEGEAIGTTQRSIATFEAEGLVKQGQLTLNFNIAADANISWLAFKNVKYTKVRDLTAEEEFVAATDEDYAALNAAITAGEAKTLGFDAGDYAPYNNIDALTTLAAANAIDQSAQNSQEDVQAATAAISGATWTVNETEVNAFFDGSFEYDYSAQTGNVQPIGWYRNEGTYSGDGYNVRYVTIPSGVEGNTSGHGLFGKFTMQYGKEAGYTLPLKAGYYKLSFSYGGYGENGTRIVKLIGETETTISTITAKNNQGNSSADAYTAFSELVNVPADGDYVLSFYRENTTNQNQIAIADIKLYRATSEDLKQQLLAEITKANAIDITTNVGDGVFQIPTSAVSALQEGISDAQSVYYNGEATSDAIITAITALKAAEEAYANIELNAPVSGQAYIIANTKADGALNIATESVTIGADAAVFFTAVDGGYVLSNADDEYIFKTTNNTWTLSTTATEAEAYVVSVAPVDGGFTIKGAKGLFGTDNTAAGSPVYANKTATNNGVWTITEAAEATMAISDAKYATFVAPFAVTIPEGVTAYTVEGVDNNVLTMTQVSTTIPANTPVVLFKEETLDATFYGNPVDGTLKEGLLTGTYEEINAPVGSYVLQKQENKVGFFLVEDIQPKVKANRAYLTAPAAGVKSFFLDDATTTGISGVMNAVATGDIYDLGGRKVSKLQKGNVYIINGKKVAVK